jgi:hypothetical protein
MDGLSLEYASKTLVPNSSRKGTKQDRSVPNIA